MTITLSALKTGTALAAFLALGGLVAPAHASATITTTYANSVFTVIIDNQSATPLTNVTLTETLLADPTSTDSTAIGTVASLSTVTSGTDFVLPLNFGPDPNNLYAAQPFTVTVTADQNGQALLGTVMQTYDASGIPTARTTADLNPAPEPSALAGLALGALSLGARSLKARKRQAVG